MSAFSCERLLMPLATRYEEDEDEVSVCKQSSSFCQECSEICFGRVVMNRTATFTINSLVPIVMNRNAAFEDTGRGLNTHIVSLSMLRIRKNLDPSLSSRLSIDISRCSHRTGIDNWWTMR